VQHSVPPLHYRHILISDRPHASANRAAAAAAAAAAGRAWSQAKAAQLLAALQHRQVATRAGLRAVWAREPGYLLAEVLLWARREHHSAVRAAWPPSDEDPGPARPAASAARQEDDFASGTDSGSGGED
jgi:hypothetical protein